MQIMQQPSTYLSILGHPCPSILVRRQNLSPTPAFLDAIDQNRIMIQKPDIAPGHCGDSRYNPSSYIASRFNRSESYLYSPSYDTSTSRLTSVHIGREHSLTATMLTGHVLPRSLSPKCNPPHPPALGTHSRRSQRSQRRHRVEDMVTAAGEALNWEKTAYQDPINSLSISGPTVLPS